MRSLIVPLFGGAFALLVACGGAGDDAAPSRAATQALVSASAVGSFTWSSDLSSSGAGTDGTSQELRSSQPNDRTIPRHAESAARVPSSGVPTPGGVAIASDGGGARGFVGLTHRDQRLAGTGTYAGTQLSLEPPDQALCVGNGYVVEGVNTAFAVYDTTGTRLRGPTAINQLFGLAPEIVRSTGTLGDFTSDPKCLFDADSGRFYLTVLQIDPPPGVRSHVLVAVSQTGDPTGSYWLYRIDTTDDGQDGTPAHPGCPCFGDQPLIGADAHGFYVTTNEFGASAFNGAQLYAMSKRSLASGVAPTVVAFGSMPLAEGLSYTLQPATVPPGGSYEAGAGGTEYFLSALDFTGTLDDRVALWALSGTRTLDARTPSLTLSNVVLASEVYGQPPDAQQKPGPTPLASYLSGAQQHLELLAGNDDRMYQVVFAGGLLWSGVNTVVKTPNGPTRVGAAWFAVSPSVGGGLAGSVAAQGYLAVNQESVLYPSIAVNAAGRGVVGVTLVGPDYFPSTAWATIDATAGVGPLHVAGVGAAPEDGFTGYPSFGASNYTARWGDYSAAVAAADGSIWLANEYIPNARRTFLANWGTYVAHVVP